MCQFDVSAKERKTGGFSPKNIFHGFCFRANLKEMLFYYHLDFGKSHIITFCDNEQTACHNKHYRGASVCPSAMLFDILNEYLVFCVLMPAHRCRQNPSSARLGHWGPSCGRGPCTGWREPSRAWLWANQRARTGDSHSGGCWSADAWERWRKKLSIF